MHPIPRGFVWSAGRAVIYFFALLIIKCTSAHAEPARVDVGILFNTIYNVDFLDGSFGAEFYVWWVSADPDFRPFEVMQILNGRQWTSRAVARRQLADGRYHTSGIVSATINHYWQLRRFPFDEQTLRIIIETPSPSTELKLVPDVKNAALAELMHVEGFVVSDFRVTEAVQHYSTNFGMGNDAARDFSRVVMELDLKRKSARFFGAFLIGFIAANVIALLTYAIHVSNLSVRTSMIGSAIFAAIGNTYFMHSAIHPAAGSLLVDVFTIVTFAMIIVALLNSIVVERMMQRHKSGLAHSINRLVFYATFLVAVLVYAITSYTVIAGPR